MNYLSLTIEVPIASFRQSRAREYAETYPVPPPSTVYGMLLSAVGETNRYRHCGVRLAIALLSVPKKSTVIRTMRRVKKKNLEDPSNSRPDYQELLTDIRFVVWVDGEGDRCQPALPQRLEIALTNPSAISRFGGLSLGESRDLVNAVSLIKESDRHQKISWLVRDEDGLLTLPYWANRINSADTRYLRYLQLPQSLDWEVPENAWTAITPD